MSHTFDSLGHALIVLGDALEDEDQWRHDILFFVKSLIDELHSVSHEHEDWLNRNPRVGRQLRLLDTAVKHSDNEDRAMWLKVKSEA